MAGGLIALLDDVATLAKLAASSLDDIGAAAGRASAKAAGVVIDDTAVTPQYVHGLAAEREVPIIRRIARGSFRNKLLIILPAALLLSEFLPGLLTPLLMVGGAYLCYEAVHKIWGAIAGHDHGHGADGMTPPPEDELVRGAIRTDLILSAEIMVIALNEVATEPLLTRAAILVVVAILITIVVYGLVAVLVRADDAGLWLAERAEGPAAEFGRRVVTAMPKVLAGISVIGTAAMLWVGGHIELLGMHEFGFDLIYDPVHDLEERVRDAAGGAGGFLAWTVNTIGSAIVGLLVGAPLVALQTLISRSRGTEGAHH